MKARAPRSLVALAVLAGTLLAIVPFGSAEAQWVFLARRVLGRIHHMAESNQQQAGQAGYSFATLSVMPFSDDIARLLIAGRSGPGGDSTTSRVVQAVMRVCAE